MIDGAWLFELAVRVALGVLRALLQPPSEHRQMGIRTTETLKADTTRVVSIHDDALDADNMVQSQLVGFMLHLDLAWLKFKDGEEPTVFVVGAIADEDAAKRVEQEGLTRARKAGVMWDEEARTGYVNEQFFRCGVREIENLDGRAYQITGRQGLWRMSESIYKQIPPAIQREIGAYVQRLTNGAVDVRPPRPGEFEAEVHERPSGELGDDADQVPEPLAPPSSDVGKS